MADLLQQIAKEHKLSLAYVPLIKNGNQEMLSLFRVDETLIREATEKLYQYIVNQSKMDDYFTTISEELLEKNRFSNYKLDRLVNSLIKFSSKVHTISAGTIIYRSRIFQESDELTPATEENHFEGYDADNSMAPPSDKTPNGRCNPQYVRCLYAAESEECCIYEAKPHIGQMLSVAKIKVTEDLHLFHIGKNEGFPEEPQLIKGQSNSDVLRFLEDWFSRPVSDEKNYIVTQYIVEKIKKKYDGIVYVSSVSSENDNLNYAIFNMDSCEAISSHLVEIEKIQITHRKVDKEFWG